MEFNPSIKESSDFNGGKRYTNHVDSPSANDFNNLIEGFLKAQEDIDNANQSLEFVSGEVDEISGEVDYLGVSVPKIEDRLSLTEKRVDNLYARTFPEIDVIDNSVAYSKVVPDGALPYAEVTKVGGMSYASENLIPFPYRYSTTTIDGVTFTVYEDGRIHIKGTPSSDVNFVLNPDDHTRIEAGDYYYSGYSLLELRPIDGSAPMYKNLGAFSITKPCYFSAYLYLRSGETIDSFYEPMLNKGTTAKPYTPYFEGLRHAKVTAVKSIGANLAMPNIETIERNGFVATVDTNRRLVVTGSANTAATTAIDFVATYDNGARERIPLLAGEEYSWSVYKNGVSLAEYVDGLNFQIEYTDAQGGTVWSWGSQDTSRPRDLVRMYLQKSVEAGSTALCGTYEVMLNIGDTVLPYVPYREANYLPIPAAVQAQPDYGKTDTYIEWRSDGRFLVTPEGETNISHLLPEDNFIPVEAGGQIVAENEYELSAPTTINYQIN